jgi:hypothetical protein
MCTMVIKRRPSQISASRTDGIEGKLPKEVSRLGSFVWGPLYLFLGRSYFWAFKKIDISVLRPSEPGAIYTFLCVSLPVSLSLSPFMRRIQQNQQRLHLLLDTLRLRYRPTEVQWRLQSRDSSYLPQWRVAGLWYFNQHGSWWASPLQS